MARQPVPFYPLDIPPGIFTEETPAGAVKRWVAGDNVRWTSDQPQKMGGYVNQPLVDQDSEDTEYMGFARSYHQWESLDGQSWMAFGTACKLYLINANTLYDITPLRQQSYIVDGVATTNGSSIVTITDVNNGAQEGDHVSFEGGTIINGVLLEGQYEVLTVLSVDTYTIDSGQVASGTGTGGGNMTVRYDISCGLESDGFLYGYGVGDYGEETYGTPRSESTFRGFMRTWSLDNWGEDLIASPNGETIYVWRRATGPQSRAEVIEGAPLNNEHVMVGPDGRHILAIGTNLASTGVQDKMFVRWCVGDDYNDWVATSENDAGSKRLDLGSRLITGVKTNRQILIWSDKALYVTSFVGGQDVYDITLVASSPELMSANSAVDVDGIVYAMTEQDFYIFDGTYRTMPCEVRNFVFGDGEYEDVGINIEQRAKVTVRLRREFNEVMWSYPQQGNDENSISVIYNYEKKCWYFSSTPRETGGDVNPYYDFAIGLYDGKLWLEENGVDADTDMALPAFLESWEAQLGAGSDVCEVSELVPDFKRIYGSVDVMLFGRNYPAEERFFGPVREITGTTTKIDPRFKKRQMGIRVESTAVGDDWRMGTWRGKYFPHGR